MRCSAVLLDELELVDRNHDRVQRGDRQKLSAAITHESVPHHTTTKGTRMTNPRDILTSLLHRLGVAGPARVCAFQGSGMPKPVGAFSRSSRLPTLVLSVFAATLGAMAFASAPASAKQVHVYSRSFGGPGEGAGEMDLVFWDDRTGRGSGSGVAVNEETHDVYIADAGNHRVDEFEPDGTFVRAWGWGVNKKSPKAELQECTAATECQAGASESAPGAFEEPVFIAIDNDPLSTSHGDVYVGDRGDDLVTKFTAEGQLEALWGTDGQLNGSAAEEGPFRTLMGIAVDSTGTLSVLTEAKHIIEGSSQDWFKFAADGVAEPTVAILQSAIPLGIGLGSSGDLYKVRDEGEGFLQENSASGQELREYSGFQGVTAFAIEPITNNIYLAQKNEVTRIPSKSESQIERFGAGHLTEGAGVAVDASTGNAASGTVYVADGAGDDVAVFALGLLPEVTVQPVSSFPSTTSATLTGTVNPQGLAVKECKFEYISGAALHPPSADEVQTVTPPAGEYLEFELDFEGETSNFSTETSLGEVQGRLEEMTTIGPGNVAVTSVNERGGPYKIEFKGALGDRALPLITSSVPSVSVAITTEGAGGGGGWGAAASVPCVPGPGEAAGDIGKGSAPVPVSATATGLTQGETYYYRLSATNAVGTESESEGTFLQPKTVVVEGESSSLVETGAVTLGATINPGGSETRYHFEYGAAAGDYEVSVPIPDREIPAELQGVEVSARATGLQPSTTYHYRVVAESGLPGAVDGPDQTFTTLTPQGTGSPANCKNEQLRAEQPYGLELPDCRAYEQVSPVENEGANIEHEMARAAVSGEAIKYVSQNSFGEPVSAQYTNSYISRRGPDGWSTQDITPPITLGRGSEQGVSFAEMVFTPELTEGTFVQLGGAPLSSETPMNHHDLFVANFADRSYELVPTVPPEFETEHPDAFQPGVSGTSTDLSHVVFAQLGALTPGASPDQRHVYDWTGGHMYQVDIPPAGTTFAGGAGAPSPSSRPVSEDGQQVVFTGPEGQLYVREHPEQPPVGGSECAVPGDACTVEVSASQRTEPDRHGPQPASFQGASADGSRVFFTSNAELTDNANTGPEDNAPNLYEYELNTGKLTDLTADKDPSDTDGASVLDAVEISEGGTYVYFVAQGVLSTAPNRQGLLASSGMDNLYVYAEGHTAFIATLSTADPFGSYMDSRVSADGTHLAFVSVRSLTGYDNQPGEHSIGCGSEGCGEIYLYDVTTGSLVCASCDRAANGRWAPRGSAPRVLSVTRNRTCRAISRRTAVACSSTATTRWCRTPVTAWRTCMSTRKGTCIRSPTWPAHTNPSSWTRAKTGTTCSSRPPMSCCRRSGDERVDVYDARVEGGFPVAPVDRAVRQRRFVPGSGLVAARGVRGAGERDVQRCRQPAAGRRGWAEPQ